MRILDLEQLIKPYSSFDKETDQYTFTKLEKKELIKLELALEKWMTAQLLVDGVDKTKIAKRYRKLSLYFHADKINTYPETKWLEMQLASNEAEAYCFKLFTTCYEKLINPEKYKQNKKMEFSNINTMEDCMRWLEESKAHSSSHAHKNLCDSLISLLNESSSFLDSTGKLKPTALRTLVQFIPATIACYGISFVMEELISIYALYFVILKGSQQLKKSNYKELKTIGTLVQGVNSFTALTTTTVLTKLIQMLLWSSRNCLEASLTVGGTLFPSASSAFTDTAEATNTEEDKDQLCQELALMKATKLKTRTYKNPQFQLIGLYFLHYQARNEQQLLQAYRRGASKLQAVRTFLFELDVCDELERPLDGCYSMLLEKLAIMERDTDLNNGKLAQALINTKRVIELLCSSSSITALLTNEERSEELSIITTCT